MTTTVKITAHCAADTEVNIHITEDTKASITTIQNGEEYEAYVYDARKVLVEEVKKK